MRDFTLPKYEQLLHALRAAGYRFVTVEEYVREGQGKICVLRHDVDARPEAAVVMAQVEEAMGVKASYYFRSREAYDNPKAIRAVVSSGHEVGYHYEDLSLEKGNKVRAWTHFRRELERLRRFYPVRTICMHGAPRSAYDGRALWKEYDYRQEGIVCEPYLDLDYSRLLYLTDTGRRWDGYKMSIRDKIPALQDEWNRRGWSFHGTDDIIAALEAGRLPEQVMLSTHPQRWVVGWLRWVWELWSQGVKNKVKKEIVAHKKSEKRCT